MILECKNCFRSFERTRLRKFCGLPCFRVWSRGKINTSPKSEKTKNLISKAQTGKSRGPMTDEHKRHISEARMGMKFSESHKKSMSLSRTRLLEEKGFWGNQSSYFSSKMNESFWAHSSLEYRIMQCLDENENVISWTKQHQIRISYSWSGERIYVPDFLVRTQNSTLLIEAKGYEFQPERCSAKADAAKIFCSEKGWIFRIIRSENEINEIF